MKTRQGQGFALDPASTARQSREGALGIWRVRATARYVDLLVGFVPWMGGSGRSLGLRRGAIQFGVEIGKDCISVDTMRLAHQVSIVARLPD